MVAHMDYKLDARGYVNENDRDLFFKRQFKIPENCVCFDCDARNPTWISLSFSIYLCLNCSGKHRQLGSHISFVRSIDMDMFTPQQLMRLQLGGNHKALSYFIEVGISRKPYDYVNHRAQAYTKVLDKLVKDGNCIDLLSDDTSTVDHCSHSESSKINVNLDELFDATPVNNSNSSNNIQELDLNIKNSFTSMSRPNPFNRPKESVNRPNFKTGFSSKACVNLDEFERTLNEVKASMERRDEVKTSVSSTPPEKDVQVTRVDLVQSSIGSPNIDTVSPPELKSPQRQYKAPDFDSFKGKSGISSDDFFKTETKHISYNSLNPNKTSLSSDEYFGRPVKQNQNLHWNNIEDQALHNINELKDGILNVISKGNNIVEKAKSWLNTYH